MLTQLSIGADLAYQPQHWVCCKVWCSSHCWNMLSTFRSNVVTEDMDKLFTKRAASSRKPSSSSSSRH